MHRTAATAAAAAAGDLDDSSDWGELLRPRKTNDLEDDGSGY